MYTCLLIGAGLLALANAIPIDNGVTGDPEIECGPTSIQVTFNTANAFEGHVYVKNRFAEEGCRKSGDASRSLGDIELGFDACGTQRERSLEPKGVFVRQTVVISFHPRFLTKVDRAYTIQCFYMEADKTVSTDIEVSMITTGFQTQVVPMPVCRYEILDASEGGNPVQFALIGQAVFHKWTCDTDTVDTFCMTVHSCTVDDGAGDSLQLLDEAGCAIDKFILGNLDYPSDLMAVKEVHVFKYADRPALFFNCQITITIKEPNGQCPRPQCAEPGGSGDGSGSGLAAGTGAAVARPAPAATAATEAATEAAATEAAATEAAPALAVLRRRRREAVAAQPNAVGTMDIRSGYETLDISAEQQESNVPFYLRNVNRSLSPVAVPSSGICLSTGVFTGLMIMAVVVIVAIVTVTSCVLFRNSGKY